MDNLPKPVTRIEQYLAYIAENGGGKAAPESAEQYYIYVTAPTGSKVVAQKDADTYEGTEVIEQNEEVT